jgi:hypothetical protein
LIEDIPLRSGRELNDVVQPVRQHDPNPQLQMAEEQELARQRAELARQLAGVRAMADKQLSSMHNVIKPLKDSDNLFQFIKQLNRQALTYGWPAQGGYDRRGTWGP